MFVPGCSRADGSVANVAVDNEGSGLIPDEKSHPARRNGIEAIALFVIQRSDVTAFTPNHRTDPAFAAALRRAARAGVAVRVMICRVSRRGVWLGGPVPVRPTRGRWL
jgi:Sugar fermentation stimulation protein RE domain